MTSDRILKLEHPAKACLLAAAMLLAPAVMAEDVIKIPEVWVSSGTNYDETDSLAAAKLRNGDVRVFATSKDGDRIDVFDAVTGKATGQFGEAGAAAGQLQYPNGIVTIDFGQRDPRPVSARGQFVAIIERDNHRVQFFSVDDQKSTGIIGAEVLKRPYGGAVSVRPGGIFLYVTDTEVKPTETVRVFRLALGKEGTVTAKLVNTFGEADGPGAVVEAESIVVDDVYHRVLLCDEHPEQRDVKVYTLDGQFTGRTFGRDYVQREPEGIVVVDVPAGRSSGEKTAGYVVLTDQQKELSVWHLFDRKNYEHLAAFTGQPTIANTDGICIYPHPLGKAAQGLLFAVDDDAEVRAYSLQAISKLCAAKLQR